MRDTNLTERLVALVTRQMILEIHEAAEHEEISAGAFTRRALQKALAEHSKKHVTTKRKGKSQ
jgi:hypothetical protein